MYYLGMHFHVTTTVRLDDHDSHTCRHTPGHARTHHMQELPLLRNFPSRASTPALDGCKVLVASRGTELQTPEVSLA